MPAHELISQRNTEHRPRVVLAGDCAAASADGPIDEVIEIPPSEHVTEAYGILSRWCSGHRVDAIFMQSEAALLVGSLLARDLRLPGPSVEAVHLCADRKCGIAITAVLPTA